MVASKSAVNELSAFGVARATIAGAPLSDEEVHKTHAFWVATRPRWPMIVLRSPKGWTAPSDVDGRKVEGLWRSHQVPLAGVKKNPAHLKLLEQWMRSYKPEELFDDHGCLIPELRELAPTGNRRMGANPHANGGQLKKNLRLRWPF